MPDPTWSEEVYQGQHSTDALLHNASLQLAKAWHSSHKGDCPLEVTDDLMQAYVNTRLYGRAGRPASPKSFIDRHLRRLKKNTDTGVDGPSEYV